MANKGISSKPPSSNKGVDPTKKGFGKGKNAALQALKAGKSAQSLQGLTQGQNQVINQRQDADIGLGTAANAMMPRIQQNFSQDFDWNSLPTAPWAQGQDIRGMAQSYQDQVYQDFARTAEPEFQRQVADFEQMAANRGWPVGSEIYNNQKKQLMDTQEGQRQSIRTQALQGSTQYGQAYNDMGTQNYQNAYTMGQARRNQPLADFNALYGGTSGMGMQNLAYSQQGALQDDAQRAQMALMKATPRGGGGGGGSTPFDLATDPSFQRWQAQQEYLKQNQPKQPSYGAQLGGGIAGAIAGGLGQGLGQQLGQIKFW